MPGGRPTDYNDAILKKTKLYLDTFDSEGDVIPTIAGLALYLGLSRETIYDWSSQDTKKEFSDIVKDLMAKQEKTLINSGLSGKFNSNIVKLALGKHGYSDKQELMGKDGEKLTIGVINYKDDNSSPQL